VKTIKISERVKLVFEDDMFTPVMIYAKDSGVETSATWACALGEGEVDGYPLTSDEVRSLLKHEAAADAWYDKTRVIQ
jgi:hypothetical protein